MIRDLNDNLAERIKRLRGRLGLTQEQLALSLGVTVTSVRNWESGRSQPGKDARGQIAAAESRGLDALLNGAWPTTHRMILAQFGPNRVSIFLPIPRWCGRWLKELN